MNSNESYEQVWRHLVEAEMTLLGYEPDEIEKAGRVPSHTEKCEFDHNHVAWNCADENGESYHPISDLHGEIADAISRVLESPHVWVLGESDLLSLARGRVPEWLRFDADAALDEELAK